MTALRTLLLCVMGVLALSGCKEKVPKLTPAECDKFCKRLVPCFAKRMANFSMKRDQDIRECIQNCSSQESQKHGPILRAMKRCGHIEDCTKLRACFQKSL